MNAGGTLYAVGVNGDSWASSFTGDFAYYLEFRCDWIYPNYNHSRAFGFQLRCLQE